jgi:uncharacterized protein (TIGR00730 family)
LGDDTRRQSGRTMLKTLGVFLGSNLGARREYRNAAVRMGRLMAARGIALVYGGSNIGLMKDLADTVLGSGGHVTGVATQPLLDKEIVHPGLTDMIVENSLSRRKHLMAELSEGFVALPGGLGTLDEFVEMLTWNQLGLHSKPCGLLNILGYYDPLLAWIERASEEGFIPDEYRPEIMVADDPEFLISKMEGYQPKTGKWL